MSAVIVELKLPSKQYDRLSSVANAKQRTISEIVQVAVIEWLNTQAQLEQARELMRELGQGIGKGYPAHNIARNHDAYLYTQKEQ